MKPEFPPIESLIAHDHPMILVDRVLASTDDRIQTLVVLTENSPFIQDGAVPAYVCIEYMAQSVAAYSGLQAKKKGEKVKVGFLLGARKLNLHKNRILTGSNLVVDADIIYNDGEMASFDCSVSWEGQAVADARMNVYQPVDPNKILDNQ